MLAQHGVDAAQRGARDQGAHLVTVVAEAASAAVPPRLAGLHGATRPVRQYTLVPSGETRGGRVGTRRLRRLRQRTVCHTQHSNSTIIDCILRPLAEMVTRETLDGFQGGLQIGGRMITNLHYADDIILLATSEAERQELVAANIAYSSTSTRPR